MLMTKKSYLGSMLLLVLALILSCCPFDQQALDLAVTCKEEAVALMGQATEPYSTHATEVEGLMAKIDGAIEYNQSRGCGCEEIVTMWEKMKNPEGGLLGGFQGLWEKEGTLGTGEIKLHIDNVKRAFDEIIDVEKSKK
jgi:hypothetical protein